MDIKKGNFSDEELEKVTNRIKGNKKYGLDNIPPEVWKTGDYNKLLLELCNAVYNGAHIEKGPKVAFCLSQKRET